MKAFTTYEKAVERARNELIKTLIPEIQKRLSIARPFGDFYVCTGMGSCSLSCEEFKVIYKDDEEVGPQVVRDDFDLGKKVRIDSDYGTYVACSSDARKALIGVDDICQKLTDDDLQYLPFKVYADRIEN